LNLDLLPDGARHGSRGCKVLRNPVVCKPGPAEKLGQAYLGPNARCPRVQQAIVVFRRNKPGGQPFGLGLNRSPLLSKHPPSGIVDYTHFAANWREPEV